MKKKNLEVRVLAAVWKVKANADWYADTCDVIQGGHGVVICVFVYFCVGYLFNVLHRFINAITLVLFYHSVTNRHNYSIHIHWLKNGPCSKEHVRRTL